MAEAPTVPPPSLSARARDAAARVAPALRAAEIDTRLFGMIAGLAIIWIGFNVVSGGDFLTPRNLWNLSVQSASIGIMATGMVLVIVSRNIDLSVGSLLGFLGYTMAMVQITWIPLTLGLGLEQPYTWIVTVLIGVALGAVLGGLQGFVIAFGRVPSFIVTLGGLLVWRGLIFSYAQGQTLAPMDPTYRLLGGGPTGSLGEWPSWIVGIIGCVAIVFSLYASRRRRRRYGFPLRPMWAEIPLGVVLCAVVLGAVWVANSYPWPEALAAQYAAQHGITVPPGGLVIPTGIAIPVLIMIGVTIVMTYLATRRRFGRNVFAFGGNPEAARLGGINTRRTLVYTFGLMGLLCGISGAIQTARLNAAVTGLGVQNELDVISAAVIGGTSFAGGIGTIPGAVLGAVIMQSLRSGMLLVHVDSPTQDIVVGIVLVAAVGLDSLLRRRTS
ncbi:MAG: D-xylose transport system permease protein [Chloroflexota bacterium]|jgi:D-xylose transport system permease protein|nr:D-xylose transport system permease protein [Chloroflexota bacterium]